MQRRHITGGTCRGTPWLELLQGSIFHGLDEGKYVQEIIKSEPNKAGQESFAIQQYWIEGLSHLPAPRPRKARYCKADKKSLPIKIKSQDMSSLTSYLA